uniref:Uncharacterized protein n=1 Tax=Anguilla anguilla TaxID=7936 RepID=A0A0E9WJA1_ANGAN
MMSYTLLVGTMQHSTTSTHYKQVDVTDVLHTEIIAIASFQLLSLVRLLIREKRNTKTYNYSMRSHITLSPCRLL